MKRNKLAILAAALLVASALSGVAAQTLNPARYFLATTPRLELGVTVSGELTVDDGQNFKDGSYLDVYAFTGDEGDELNLWLGSNDFDTFLTVFDPSGNLYDWNDDSWELSTGDHAFNSHLSMYLGESGTYTVIVSGYSAWDLGSYSLMLDSVHQPAVVTRTVNDAEEITVPGNWQVELDSGLPVTGEGFGGPSRAFSFELHEDLLVVIDATAETVDTTLLLYSAAGELLALNDDYYDPTMVEFPSYWVSRITIELPAGRYHLVLGSFSEHDAGTANLAVSAYRSIR